MTLNRIGSIPYYGKGTCRGCQREVPKGRQTWCSDACVTDALIRKGDPNVVRREVFKRDAGVCVGCGIDIAQLERVIIRLESSSGRDAALWLMRAVFGPRMRLGDHLWEADHVVPVVEGGGGCGLDGYRTLCRNCHKRETAELARRRARQRHEAAMPLLPEAEA